MRGRVLIHRETGRKNAIYLPTINLVIALKKGAENRRALLAFPVKEKGRGTITESFLEGRYQYTSEVEIPMEIVTFAIRVGAELSTHLDEVGTRIFDALQGESLDGPLLPVFQEISVRGLRLIEVFEDLLAKAGGHH